MVASSITATEQVLLSGLNAPQLRTKYISPAKSGNIQALSRLEVIIKLPNAAEHVTEILDIYFSNVKSEFIPTFVDLDRRTADAISNTERAWICIRGIWLYLEPGPLLPSGALHQLYESIRPRLLPHISNICRWLLFFLERSPTTYLGRKILHSIHHHPTISATSFFEYIVVLNELKQPFLSNDTTYQLCVRLWSLKTQDVDAAPALRADCPNEYLIYALPEKVGMDFCPIIWTIRTLMKTPYGRSRFLRVWHGHYEALGLDSSCVMAESILSRISVLQLVADNRPTHLAPLWENLWYLGCLLISFAYDKERPMAELVFGQRVLSELGKRQYRFHFTRLLQSISEQSMTPPYSSKKLAIENFVGTGRAVLLPLACLNFIVTVLFKDTSRRSTSLLSHYGEFVNGGILHIAANCSQFLTSTSEPRFHQLMQGVDMRYYAPLCADVITIVTSYSVYPPILKALRHSLQRQPLTPAQLNGITTATKSHGIIVERDPDGSRPMADIRDGILASYDVYKYLTLGRGANAHLPDICDHAEHVDTFRTYKQGKVCSGCQLALYCSKQCQKGDWELHKHECQQGRQFRKESKAKDDWYRPAWRKYHVARILDHYAASETHVLSAPIARLDCQRGTAEWATLRPENYDVDVLEGPETTSQLNTRFESFLRWIRESTAQSRKEKRRLLELVLPFGDKSVIPSVKATLDGDVINAGASIVRMGPVPLPDVSESPGEYGGIRYNTYD